MTLNNKPPSRTNTITVGLPEDLFAAYRKMSRISQVAKSKLVINAMREYAINMGYLAPDPTEAETK